MEVLNRRYPDDVCADYPEGIVITLPRSKTNFGPHAEHFAIRHDPEDELCGACALKAWLDWLGSDYRGPLFPLLHGGVRVGTGTFKTINLNIALGQVMSSASIKGQRLTTYSSRKGPATAAAARGCDLGEIQQALRHESFACTTDYIHPDVLSAIMKDPIG